MASPIFSFMPRPDPNAAPYPLQDTLLGLGIGLLSNRGLAQGAGQGLLLANQFAGQRRAERRQDEQDRMQREMYEAQVADAKAKADAAAAAKKGYADWLAPMFDADPTNDIPGLTKQQAMFMQSMTPDQGYGLAAPFMFPKPADLPSAVEEYKFAQGQGYGGTFEQWQIDQKKAGASNTATTIYNKDYGSIPPGFRLVETPEGVQMEAVPGSPAATEAQEKFNKEIAATEQKKTVGDVVLDDIGRSLDLSRNAKGMPSTGFWGAILQGAPGTNAHDLQQTLQSVKANISFDRLQQMRQASPTGGALGSVTEGEGKKLESVYGALEQSQTQGQFEYNLKRVANLYMDIVHGEGNGPPRYDLGGGKIGAGGQPDESVVDQLPPGFQ